MYNRYILFITQKKMKKLLYVYFGIVVTILSVAWVNASTSSRGNYGTSPTEVLDRVVGEANIETRIQDTQLDRISGIRDWQFASKYQIANTLDSIRVQIAPYLQWFMFIGLSIATVMIIITGFQLVTSVQSGSDTKKASARIKNIAIGIIIMTWFYVITRLFMSLVAYVLQG